MVAIGWLILGALGAALLGALAGALVNALADRVVGVDEPIWSATQCRKCLAPLPPAGPLALRELVAPGRVCANCGKRASLRRPLTQLALALLLPAALWRALVGAPPRAFPGVLPSALPTWALFALAAASLITLAFIFVVDLEHRLIYDLAIFPLTILLLVVVGVFDRHRFATVAISALICAAIFLLFYGLGWLIYRQEALGFGDVKLALLVGAIVGWPGVTTALLVTAVLAAIFSLLLLASGADRRAFIPFGVFLTVGAAFALLSAPLPW
ncbi:MAG TPA: A24 family peptidase [Ktedonobacterales bacterium]